MTELASEHVLLLPPSEKDMSLRMTYREFEGESEKESSGEPLRLYGGEL